MNNTRTRTFIATGAVALALGLTGCATPAADNASATASPSVSATPFQSDTVDEAIASASAEAEAERAANIDDLSVMLDYKKVIGDFQDLLSDLQDYVDDDNTRGAKGLGNDFVLAAREGKDLDDIPDASRAANRAWDKAMDEYLVMGGSLQMGMFTMAGESMNTATDYLVTAAKEID